MALSENRCTFFRAIKPFVSRMIWSENRCPLFGIMRLTLPVQDGDEREQPARGLEVDPHLALQPLLQRARALVMDAAAAHIDGLDLVRRRRADRLVVAVADHEIVLHDPPERR